MKSSFSFFRNKWINAALLVTLLQQLLVASGTYLLGHITSQYPTEGIRLGPVLLLFFCIFLPGTIVAYWIVWCTTRASKAAQLNYLNEYIQSNYNHPTHWRNKDTKHRHDIMCKGGQETIQSTVNFLIDCTATSLNIILNTISVILVTDLTLGLVIVSAGLLGLLIIHFARNGIAETSRNEMLAENRLNAHMSRSWDNIVLGNQFFFDRWKNHFNELFLNTEKASLDAVKNKELVVYIAGMVTNGVILGTALFLAWMNQGTAGFVLAILVMLPRSLQIVIHIQIIQTYLAQWKNLQEKLIITRESLGKLQSVDLSPLIQEDRVSVKLDNQKYSSRDIEKLLAKKVSGRFTITGQNGVGKSSLLLKLKNKFSLAATYLPAYHQLMLRDDRLSLSSGEVALSALKDLQSENCGILLIDEWDANLSAENREILDKVIHQLSLERIVVEIRHSIGTSDTH